MGTVKQSVKRILPESVFRRLKMAYRHSMVIREATIDARRHIKYGAEEDDLFSGGGSPRNIECQLTKDYHRIEKGLALRKPKRPFGDSVRRRIESGLNNPMVGEQLPEVSAHAQSALNALTEWNVREEIADDVSPTVNTPSVWDPILETEAQVLLSHFFATRRSIRAFDPNRSVDLKDIRQAVNAALSTPSVCNRQAWRVHLYTDQEDVARVIGHQNGNSGFGHAVPVVAVLTVDTRLFAGAGERHQRWIDGGLFAMSFAYGLHAAGLASCMLNWSMKNDASTRLRLSAGIDDHEDVLMLMAIGHTEDSVRVARSPRRAVDDVLKTH